MVGHQRATNRRSPGSRSIRIHLHLSACSYFYTHLATGTYANLHPPTAIYIHLHLRTPVRVALHLPPSAHIYLHLFTSSYIYLHLPTSIYIYLHLPTSIRIQLHPVLCVSCACLYLDAFPCMYGNPSEFTCIRVRQRVAALKPQSMTHCVSCQEILLAGPK